MTSAFRSPGPDEPGLRVLATLTSEPFLAIASHVQAMIEEKDREQEEEAALSGLIEGASP